MVTDEQWEEFQRTARATIQIQRADIEDEIEPRKGFDPDEVIDFYVRRRVVALERRVLRLEQLQRQSDSMPDCMACVLLAQLPTGRETSVEDCKRERLDLTSPQFPPGWEPVAGR